MLSFFRKFSINTIIIVAFTLVILMQLVLGLASMNWMRQLSSDTTKFYNHPYRVSNATRDLLLNMIEIDSHMKDIVSNGPQTELESDIAKINEHDHQFINNLEVISQSYLSDKSDIKTISDEFIALRKIHYNVIGLAANGHKIEAQKIFRDQGLEQQERLNLSIKKISVFAAGKAESIYQESISRRDTALKIKGFLLFIIITASIIISILVYKNLSKTHEIADKRIRDYFHLIDQNILILSMNQSGVITDISNSFCRLLGTVQHDLTGKNWKSIFNEGANNDEILNQIWKTLQTGASWKGEISRLQGDKDIQWFEIKAQPVYNSRYISTEFSIIAEDITDKKIIQHISEIDPLTSLRNRRSYDDILSREIRRASRHKYSLTMAVLDIDHFKKYNDTYGHQAGDQALIRVAEVIKNCMSRSSDFAFRIGGEEFALLFSGLSQDESRAFLDRIRQSIEDLHIPHELSDISEYLTVSTGAKFCSHDSLLNPSDFFSQADKSLYAAKKMRNSVNIT